MENKLNDIGFKKNNDLTLPSLSVKILNLFEEKDELDVTYIKNKIRTIRKAIKKLSR